MVCRYFYMQAQNIEAVLQVKTQISQAFDLNRQKTKFADNKPLFKTNKLT